jgi:hypothetical protein
MQLPNLFQTFKLLQTPFELPNLFQTFELFEQCRTISTQFELLQTPFELPNLRSNILKHLPYKQNFIIVFVQRFF